MKFYFKKNVYFVIALFFYCSAYAFIQELILAPAIETSCFNFTETVAQETLTSYTILHEDYVTVVQDYHNLANDHHIHAEANFDFKSFSELSRPTSSFDCQLPTHCDLSQSSSVEKNINHLDDHLKDFATDQRRQSMQNEHTPLNHGVALGKIYTVDGLEAAVLLPDIESFLQRCEYSLRYQLQEKACSFTRKKTLAELQAKPNFINALRSGKIVQLMRQIQNSDLATAEAAYSELQQLWPWKHKHSFLNMDLYSTKELKFISTQLGGMNVMKITERELITRPDYIAKYADKQFLKMVGTYIEKCRLLQRQGNYNGLCKEVEQLRLCVSKNGKKESFATNTYLAISTKFLVAPITTRLYNIAHLTIEEAYSELQKLEFEVISRAHKDGIVLNNEIAQWTTKQYGFDCLDAAHKCYRSNPGYVDIPQNQTVLSDPINCIVSNVKDKKLPEAHAELVHFEGQIEQELADRNIVEPAAQQERIIQDFGSDVRVTVRDTYQERSDVINLIEHFIPIDVPNAAVEILNTNMTYESVSSGFEQVAQQVLANAKLCDLECLPHVEDQIIESLHVIRAPKNDVEFVFNVTIVDHLLTDLQCQAEAIAAGKPTLWERSPELFARAMRKFISGLNPIEQAKSIGSLLHGGGQLLVNAASHPVDAAQNAVDLTTNLCDFVIKSARFSCDTISGIYYLSPEERLLRLDAYWQAASVFCETVEPYVTAENIIDVTAQIAADIAFGKGFFRACTYLKEIDAMCKVQHGAAEIACAFKKAVDTHLIDNPILITAEGVVIKMSNDMHNFGGGAKEIINSAKALLDSVYAPIAVELGQEIEAIIKVLPKLPDGFATFANKSIKISYEHILGIEINWADKIGVSSKLGGFHHDFNSIIEKREIIKFTRKFVNEHGCYSAILTMDGIRPIRKTFFPADWSRGKVINKVVEAYKDFKQSGKTAMLLPEGKYQIRGFTKEGIEIEMNITQKGIIKTAYPIVQQSGA